jgi:hypothetical protein
MKLRSLLVLLPERRTTSGLSTALVVVVFSLLLSASRPAWAGSHLPLEYRCGPVLETFKIYPLYWGKWTPEQIKAQQEYLKGLTAYISGVGAPKGQEPTLRQYGVNAASVADPPARANPEGEKSLTEQEIENIIKNNARKLPAFDTHTLIMVFLGTGSSLSIGKGKGYHHSESTTAFWAAVPQNAGPSLERVTSHEVFEAATDPGFDQSKGWISADGQEANDGCNSPVTLPFGPIGGSADNTQGGTCSTTGYIPVQKKFNQISFKIVTGGDDLRGDSSATASICFPGGAETFALKSQSDKGWAENSDNVKTFSITGPARPLSFFDSTTITLTSHNSFPETDDNWNIQSVGVTVKGSDGSKCVLDQKGTPLKRLTGSSPSVTLYGGNGC